MQCHFTEQYIHFYNMLSLQSHGLEQKIYCWTPLTETQWGDYITVYTYKHWNLLIFPCVKYSYPESWNIPLIVHKIWKMWPCQVFVHFYEMNLMKRKWHSSSIIKAIVKAMAAAVMACDLVVFLATLNDLEIPHLTWECVAEPQIAVMTVQFNNFLPPLSLYPSNHHQSITLLTLRGDVVG